MIHLLFFSTGFFVVGGVIALVACRSPLLSTIFGVCGAVGGAVTGLVAAVNILLGAPAVSLHLAWNIPFGSFSIRLDSLSGFFLVPVLGLSALAAIYGGEYFYSFAQKRSLGVAWFFFNLLVASMELVLLAQNAVLFLMAWEVMSIASFFLVTFNDEKESVREAGWIYLVATHFGTAFLFVLFLLMGQKAGSLDFDRFGAAGVISSSVVNLLFLLAVVGFGTKAGFIPFHVWLPDAHPAAPSPVSALMSGVMIKTGIYGLIRILILLGQPPAWWGGLILGIGVTSGVLGVLFALTQHDLKRLLAYHSVENIGIIALGLGTGLLGLSFGSPLLAVLGFGGGLLHVLNHAIFKGLLFLGAGSVLHEAGTLEMDHLGGLSKKMPWTAAVFLVGSVAICGLPPLNGFISEFMIYVGSFKGILLHKWTGGAGALPFIGTILGLALIGGLAVACFSKAFGVIFLGEPRSEHSLHVHEPGLGMRLPMLVLAATCFVIGMFPSHAVQLLSPVIQEVARLPLETVQQDLLGFSESLRMMMMVFWGFLALVLVLIGLRKGLLLGRKLERGLTWNCGYARSTPRMQYTSSSFAQPLTDLFHAILRTKRKVKEPRGIFPEASSLSTETPDVFRETLYQPFFRGVEWTLSKLRWLQHGHVQYYVLYIAFTLLVLLVWKLR